MISTRTNEGRNQQIPINDTTEDQENIDKSDTKTREEDMGNVNPGQKVIIRSLSAYHGMSHGNSSAGSFPMSKSS